MTEPRHKLEGKGPYTTTLTNKNTACNMAVFDFKASGIHFTVSGNDLVISTPPEITSEVSVEGGWTDTQFSGDNFIFWYDPTRIDQTRMQHGPDPVPCYFKLRTENSGPPDGSGDTPPLEGDYSITIRKFEAGSNEPLDGAAFDVEYLGPNADIVVPPPPAPEPDPGEGIAVLADDEEGGGDAHVEIPTWGPKRVTIESGGQITIRCPSERTYLVLPDEKSICIFLKPDGQ